MDTGQHEISFTMLTPYFFAMLDLTQGRRNEDFTCTAFRSADICARPRFCCMHLYSKYL
jgi:hypothetical protein